MTAARLPRVWRATMGTTWTRDEWRHAALIGGVVAVEVAVALAATSSRLLPLAGAFVLAAAFVVVARWPFAAAAALVVLIASALPSTLIVVPAGPLELRGHELLLGMLFVVACVVPRRRTWGGAAGAALAVFLTLLTLSALFAVADGRTTMSDALNWGRPFAYCLLFYVVVRLFPARAALERLLTFAAVVGGLTGAVSLLLATSQSLPAMIAEAGEEFAVDQEGITGDLSRVRLPGTALAYALLWFAVLRMVRGRGWQRAGWALVVLGMVVNLALSFNRNMWAASLAGLAVLLVIGGVHLRRAVSLGAAAAAAAVAVALLAGVGVDEGSAVRPIVDRASTLFDPRSVSEESSLRDRGRETERALDAVQGNLGLGLGVGAEFGVYRNQRQLDGSWRAVPQLYLHNQYLYLLVVAGIPGVLAFLAFAAAILRRAVRSLRDADVAAWTIGFGEILLSAVVMIALSEASMLVAVALLAGAISAATAGRWAGR